MPGARSGLAFCRELRHLRSMDEFWPYRVLFVCLGNICRSPMAEATFRALVAAEGLSQRIRTDSAATGPWHVGKPPDGRAQSEMRRRGRDMSALRARQVRRQGFDRFDLILAMALDNLDDLWRMAGAEYRGKVRLFLDFAERPGTKEVPDPYYGGADGFAHALDLIEQASEGLLAHIRKEAGLA
mgnify:CR=1 FL=1